MPNTYNLRKRISIQTTQAPHQATVLLGQQTRSIGCRPWNDGRIEVTITTFTKGTKLPKTAVFQISVSDQRHPLIQETLTETLAVIESANQAPTTQQRMHLFHRISSVSQKLHQFFCSPEDLAEKIPVRLDQVYPFLAYHEKERADAKGPTIYTCGRPKSPRLSAEDQARIHVIARELLQFVRSTDEPVSNIPHGSFQGSVCLPKAAVPLPFERWLADIGPLLDAEGLTDTYSIYYSIRFLMANTRINSGTSYALNDQYAEQRIGTETWVNVLAQALVLVSNADLPLFQSLADPGWESDTEAVLKLRLGYSESSFKDYFESFAHTATDSVALPPTLRDNPVPYLRNHIGDSVANQYLTMTPDQQILIKGLTYCHKVTLKNFVLAFTAGATGRERTARQGGQCGAEYAKRAESAIKRHAKIETAPTTFSELIFSMIRDFRVKILRDITVGTSTGENTGFEGILLAYDGMENPNLQLTSLPNFSPVNRGIFLSRLTLDCCASELHQLFSQSTPEQKTEWARLLDDQDDGSIDRLAGSAREFYPLFAKLGLCQAVKQPLPSDLINQRVVVLELVGDILFLRPDAFSLVNGILDLSIPNHKQAFETVKKRLLLECVNLPGLSESNRAFIQGAIETDGCHLTNKDIHDYLRYTSPAIQDHETILSRIKHVSPLFAQRLVAYCREKICSDYSNIHQTKSCHRDLLALYTATKHVITPSFIATERLAIRNIGVYPFAMYIEDLVLHMYAQIPDLLTKELVQAERDEILRASARPNIDSLKGLYRLYQSGITPEFVKEERSAFRASTLYEQFEVLDFLCSLIKPDLISLEVIQDIKSMELTPYEKNLRACQLYTIKPSILTEALICEERNEISGLDIEFFCERVSALYAIKQSLLTPNLIVMQCQSIRSAKITELRKIILVTELLAINPNAVPFELIQTQRAHILHGKLTVEEKQDWLQKLYEIAPVAPNSESISIERMAIRDSDLLWFEKAKFVQNLYTRNRSCLTLELIHAERNTIRKTEIFTDLDRAKQVNQLYTLGTDLLTPLLIQEEYSANLESNLTEFDKITFNQSLILIRPSCLTPELIQTHRTTVLWSDLYSSQKIGFLKTWYQAISGLFTATDIQAERHAILQSKLYPDDQQSLLMALYLVKPDFLTANALQTEAAAINASQLDDLSKATTVYSLYALNPSILTVDLIHSQRSMILNSDLNSKVFEIKALYALRNDLFSASVILNEVMAIVSSTLHSKDKESLIFSLYQLNDQLTTLDAIQGIRAILESGLSVVEHGALIQVILGIFDRFHRNRSAIPLACAVIESEQTRVLTSQLRDDLQVSLIQSLYCRYRPGDASDDPSQSIGRLRFSIQQSTLSMAGQQVLLNQLWQLSDRPFSLDYTITECLYTVQSTSVPQEKIELLKLVFRKLDQRRLTSEMIDQVRDVIRSASLSEWDRSQLIKQLFYANRALITDELIRTEYLRPNSMSDIWLVDLVLPQTICDHFYRDHQSNWLWNLLDTSWDEVMDRPIVSALRQYNRTGITLTASALHTLIRTYKRRPLNQFVRPTLSHLFQESEDRTDLDLMIYVGHLKQKNPQSRKARLIVEHYLMQLQA